MDEELRLLNRQSAFGEALANQGGVDAPGTVSALLVTTTATTYPTSAARYYAVEIADAGGTETEGSTGSATAKTGKFSAYNLGASIPPVGTAVVGSFVGDRWVFRYG